MHIKPSERRPVRTVVLLGILTSLFFGMAGLTTVTFGSSDAFYPDTTKEITIMHIAQAATTAENARPPIDLVAPAIMETATFALG